MRRYQFFFLILILISCENNDVSYIQKTDKLNVLFIISDDLNCDLGTYGNNEVSSPNLDALSKKGVQFNNAHCQYPHCGPSRSSIMTGMYSDQTKILDNNIYLRSAIPDVVTLAQRFKQQGYQSIRIGKIFHLDNPGNIGTSGIDDVYSWTHTINPYGRDKVDEHLINSLAHRRYGGTLSWLAAEGKDNEQTDGIAATEAIEQLEKFANSGDNFFLALGFMKPHLPFVAPAKYFETYCTDSLVIPDIPDEYLSTLPLPSRKSISSRKLQINLKDSLAKEIKQGYYATVSFMDEQVGRVLKKLKETGLDRNTIVVFTSDHGFHLGEHGHWQKQTLFENSTKVPLIFYIPDNISNDFTTNTPVELIDIYPTLLDLVGIEIPKNVTGRSLKEVLFKRESSVRASALTKWRNGYSIKTERYRITSWGESGSLGFELYDHRYDAQELNNLANDSSYSSVFDSLKVVLNNRIIESKQKPQNLGRQIEGIQPIHVPKVITYRDIHNLNGDITFYNE